MTSRASGFSGVLRVLGYRLLGSGFRVCRVYRAYGLRSAFRFGRWANNSLAQFCSTAIGADEEDAGIYQVRLSSLRTQLVS